LKEALEASLEAESAHSRALEAERAERRTNREKYRAERELQLEITRSKADLELDLSPEAEAPDNA
jgi:hypothetical protein